MRRLLRWAFNGAAAVSIVLLLGTCLLWVRSYLPDALRAGVVRGQLAVCMMDASPKYADDVFAGEGQNSGIADLQRHAAASGTAGGLTWCRGTVQGTAASGRYWGSTYGISYTLITIPLAYPACLFALVIASYAMPRFRQRRRVGKGMCRSCGYDLRATPGRCPECGAEPVEKPTS